mmetsp:Transcript_87674/g.183298  ORF Transcript_87674/g.183298 Transcript_87674/m.183298 type:complete len:128 (-) Transcript_87674:319-702(-)
MLWTTFCPKKNKTKMRLPTTALAGKAATLPLAVTMLPAALVLVTWKLLVKIAFVAFLPLPRGQCWSCRHCRQASERWWRLEQFEAGNFQLTRVYDQSATCFVAHQDEAERQSKDVARMSTLRKANNI